MSNKMNMKQKSTIGVSLIYAIVFIVLNVLIFLVFRTHTNVFWLSYAFIVIAFIANMISTAHSFKEMTIDAAFFGIPLVSLALYYLIAEVVVGIIFMAFQQAGFKLALIIQLIMFAIFMITAIIAFMARGAVEEINQEIKEKVNNLRTVLVDVEMIMDACSDPELKEKIRKLTETIRYSDPISNESVENVERRILGKVPELRYYVEHGQLSEASQIVDDLERLYIERNKKLAISK